MNHGTSRKERALHSLNPSNFKLDGRSLLELYENTKVFAKTVVYEEVGVSENWESFFEEGEHYLKALEQYPTESISTKNCPPHLGLFIAFLHLFQSLQEQYNSLSQAQLKFFYHKILQQEPSKMREDHVYVFMELARNTTKLHLKKNTGLLAGKDADKNPITYRTNKEIFLNKAVVAQCKAIYNGKGTNDSVYAFNKVSEIQEVLGGNVTKDTDKIIPGWYPFGNPDLLRESAELGFGISAPTLVLGEGKRTICIDLKLEENPQKVLLNKLDTSLMEVHLSTADGWLTKPLQEISLKEDNVQFKVVLDKLDAPLAPPHAWATQEAFKKMLHPVMKITLKQGYSFHSYSFLQGLKVSAVMVNVAVEGIENLLVKNDYGLLDIGQNLQPFGFTPMVGANLYIQAPELACKNTNTARLTMDWKGLPENFKSYYEGYKGETNSLVEQKEDFKITAAIRRNKEWVPIPGSNGPTFNLFEEHLQFNQDTRDTETATLITSDSDNGILKITLVKPDNAFGHSIYPAVYTRAIMAQVQQKDAPIPNPPYTPTIENIRLNYQASEVFDTEVSNSKNQHFFHIEPFGIAANPIQQLPFPLVSPNYNAGGQLFLGIEQLHPPEQLNLFFEIKEENILDKPEIEIAYLSVSGWKKFSKNQLLSDATLGLKQTGIITLNIPADATDQGSVMPAGLFWIKLVTKVFPERYDRILKIRTNAVCCTLDTAKISLDYEVNNLPANTIKSFLQKKSQVKKIEQLYPSFGGAAAESDEAYFTRVSEHLSHKNRAVTAWDIERLVLQEFQEIYQVICYPNTNEFGNQKGGHMHLVVIPKMSPSNENIIRKPQASAALLSRIKTYLIAHSSPHIKMSVGNPVYEVIKINAAVSFEDEVDAGFYLEKLENDLKKYLSPWAFEREQKIEMGTSMYTSSLIKFIELQPYINFVARVKIDKDSKRIRSNEITADPRAILVSSNKHNIQVVEPKTLMCQTNQGIAQMIVDINFQVE